MKLCDNVRSTYVELNRNLLLLQKEGIVANITEMTKQGREELGLYG